MTTATTGRGTVGLLPGLLLAIVCAVAAFGASTLIPFSPLVLALALGLLVGNLVSLPVAAHGGLTFAAGSLLRLGIVALGFRLALGELVEVGGPGIVVVLTTATLTFFAARWFGSRLGLSRELSTLIGAGYAICGLSAVAAVDGVVQAEEAETAYAVGLVTLAGTSSIVLLPFVGRLLGLEAETFGLWAGGAVHDVAQTVATASVIGEAALATAIVIKLTRVALLAPLVALLAWQRRGEGTTVGSRPPLLPLFIVGFLGAVALRTTGLLPAAVVDGARVAEGWLLATALAAVGTRVVLADLRKLGGAPLVLGLSTWVIVAAVSFASAQLFT